jgi:serine/threonine-protein kinase
VSSIPPPPKSLPPPFVGDFVVCTSLASGGLGRVLLAHPIGRPGDIVALKRAHPHLAHEPDVREMWEREARYTRAIRHPCVVAGRGLIDAPGELVMALDYVHGPSLAALLDACARTGDSLPVPFVTRVVLDLLAALGAVHALREEDGAIVVHGDVNPRNVLVDVRGRAFLCDLGLAGPEAPYEERGVFRGSAAYSAPETVVRGERRVASDLFAIGVVLWETLRTERLFRGAGEADSLRRVVDLEPPPLDLDRPDLAPYAPLVSACLSKDPAARPPTADACTAALAGASVASREEVAAIVKDRAAPELARREASMPRLEM